MASHSDKKPNKKGEFRPSSSDDKNNSSYDEQIKKFLKEQHEKDLIADKVSDAIYIQLIKLSPVDIQDQYTKNQHLLTNMDNVMLCTFFKMKYNIEL